jgi:hypothetical protein
MIFARARELRIRFILKLIRTASEKFYVNFGFLAFVVKVTHSTPTSFADC